MLFLFIISVIACDRPDPEPEKHDPIYSDMLNEAKSAEGELKSAEKDLEGFQKDLENAVPQTGQIKFAQKRVFETKERIEKLRQMKDYWELRAESRVKWDRKEYLKAFHKKEPWPDPKEYEEYKMLRKLQLAPKNWDNRKRLEETKLGESLKGGKSEGGGHEKAESHEESHSEH